MVLEAKTTCKTFLKPSIFAVIAKMAKSKFEYVKNFELDDTILPNSWIVIRLDGKCFHKFCDDHSFTKPNDLRALKLMNYAAFNVVRDFNDILAAYGQSDEYSFIIRKHSTLYKRRAAKLLTTINSKFTSCYVYYWPKFFKDAILKHPPVFDGRIVVYPSEENIKDYLKWRQADVHINNLYNTTFWTLIQEGKLNPSQAEKRLCGTLASDKNEILFKEFNLNYNNEPEIFRRGTLLLRKTYHNDLDDSENALNSKKYNVIVDIHDDMLKEKFWTSHPDLFSEKPSCSYVYEGPATNIISEQISLQKGGWKLYTKMT